MKKFVSFLFFMVVGVLVVGIHNHYNPTTVEDVKPAFVQYCEMNDLDPDDYELVETWYGWDIRKKDE